MFSKLVAKGMASATVKAVEFEEALGVRGTSSDNAATLWEARITNLDGSKPDYVSRDSDPDKAMAGAVGLFDAQRKPVPSKKKAPPKPKKKVDPVEDFLG